MGIVLKQRSKSIIEYSIHHLFFNMDVYDFLDMLYEMCPDELDYEHFKDEYGEYYKEIEISRDTVYKIINEISDRFKPDEKIFKDCTTKDIIRILEEMLYIPEHVPQNFSNPEYIYLDII